ncbi:MAG TPA: hypothetical protein VHS09_15330 [Polyangiaceae bacterium]|nr:hypothetical protein [Polyangiaceae bacterium]
MPGEPLRLVAVAALLLACGGACGGRSELDDGRQAGAASPDGSAGDALASCGAGGPTQTAYALDGAGVLYRYDPATGRSTVLGAPDCGNASVPWTMTASNERAFIVYTDWTLDAVSLTTLACTPTAFQSGQLGLDAEFGVAAVGAGASEKLFVYGVPSGGSNAILAVSDTRSFVLAKLGDVLPSPAVGRFPVNLTADASGHLYAFSPLGLVEELDASNGTVLRSVDTGITSETWATLAYGGALYLWADSHVVGYDLASRARTSDRDSGIYAIGAGTVSVCP